MSVTKTFHNGGMVTFILSETSRYCPFSFLLDIVPYRNISNAFKLLWCDAVFVFKK